MSSRDYGLRSRADFQRFCAELRVYSSDLDGMVEALHALVASSLPLRDRTRFARLIARALAEAFPAEISAITSVPWPPEIAMALKRHDPTAEGPLSTRPAPSGGAPSPWHLEIDVDPGGLTVVFMGDDDEHRFVMERVGAELGFHTLRVTSLQGLDDAVERETVVGLVVGASWWSAGGPTGPSPRRRLERLLCCSNLYWLKLVRSPTWASAEDGLFELYRELYFREPTRVAVADQPMLVSLDLGGLSSVIRDITYAERRIRYEFQPSNAQDGLIRAVASRYLAEKYPPIHAHYQQLHARALANRGGDGVVTLISVEGTGVSFVLKVSPQDDARGEALRFRTFAHGAAFHMDFYCHGRLGALAFAPIETQLGDARSLEDLLDDPALDVVEDDGSTVPHRAAMDSAITALEHFSRQARAGDLAIFCTIEWDTTTATLHRLGPIMVAGERVDLQWLYQAGIEILDRCSRGSICHGDAHPGNILFSATQAAILIDYECAGLGPPGYDPSSLWVFAMATHFVAIDDESSLTAMLRELLTGASFTDLCRSWPSTMRPSRNRDLVYLAHRAIGSALSAMEEHGLTREDAYGIMAVILGRELLNPSLQQLVIRCALAAIQSLLKPKTEPACQ